MVAPTPSDSAITAEEVSRAIGAMRAWAQIQAAVPMPAEAQLSRDIASLIERLSTDRTKLAADLARVNFLLAKDGEILERVLLMEKAHEEATDRALAAEAKSARLVEAARAVVISTSKLDRHGIPDTDMEPVMLGKLRALSAALTLPEPSHEP